MHRLDVSYATLKMVASDILPIYWVLQGDSSYTVFTATEVHLLSAAVETESDIADFESIKVPSNEVASEDDATALGYYIAAGAPRTTRRTLDGKAIIATEKPDSSKATIVTHDWTDNTTWYMYSIRVVEEVASCDNAPTYTVYSVAHTGLIDTYHGKLFQEDFLKDAVGNSYRVVVAVNDVAKTEQDPHSGSGGDYIVDYVLGKITFLSALAEDDEVKVTYHYATSGAFLVKPLPGKSLMIDIVEVQFATDVVLTDTIRFQAYGYVDAFAPQLMGAPYNIPSLTKIPLGDPLVYKTFRDYANDALKSYTTYPPLGAGNWRGLNHETIVFDWDYVRSTVLRSSLGMEIRLTLDHDIPFGGSYATATLYCASENE